jgi:hypothetical protein
VAPRAPFDVLPNLHEVPRRPVDPSGRRANVALVVEGWPDDLSDCLDRLLTHLPSEVGVLALDVADVDGAGARLHGYAQDRPDRVEALHVAAPGRFGAARAALLRYETTPVHIWMETSTLFDGDAVTPLLAPLDDPTVVGAGWRGVAVNDDWFGFHDMGPGEVEALLGYLLALRTEAARRVADDPAGPLAKARFYRNVDLHLSLSLRDQGGRLVVPDGTLPVHLGRHRGYHDADPEYRDRESRRNYRRLLDQFRGRDDLRLPRDPD